MSFVSLPVRCLRAGQTGYPKELLEIAQHVRGFAAPDPLWMVGQLPPIAPRGQAVAVVGARACTPSGLHFAAELGRGLALASLTVVSGAARGIDQAAMRGAVAAGGRVIAVLGSGIARPYPPEARGLLAALVQADGAVLSEFPPESTPRRHHFPQRNRLLAALSQVVVVVEAGERSGTMNTVRWALELGRDVAAVPGPAGAPASAGPHRLIREGAALVEHAQDVLALLGSVPSDRPRRPATPSSAEDPLLRALRGAGCRLEELAQLTGWTTATLEVQLGRLELEGQVRRGPGGVYHRTLS